MYTVVVFATASLREPFEALARRYETDHPGAKVDLHLDGGAQLFAQCNGGATVDVLAIGDSSLMSRFASGALLASSSPTELARNRLAMAVAAGNPKKIETLQDLARADVRTVLGNRSSSIGRHSRWVLSRRQIVIAPVLETNTAAAALATVQAGEADAAIVYATSFRSALGVMVVPLPEADNTPVLYSISVARGAAEPLGAKAFRSLALSEVGQGILQTSGFLPIGSKAP